MDKKTVARLVRLGIATDVSPWRMSKEEALVIIGEAMFERFVKEFRDVWKELFSNRQAGYIEVSSERTRQYVRGAWKSSTEYRGVARFTNVYLRNRVTDPSYWYLWKGGDRHGVAGTYRFD
jgi:hypothetical protein